MSSPETHSAGSNTTFASLASIFERAREHFRNVAECGRIASIAQSDARQGLLLATVANHHAELDELFVEAETETDEANRFFQGMPKPPTIALASEEFRRDLPPDDFLRLVRETNEGWITLFREMVSQCPPDSRVAKVLEDLIQAVEVLQRRLSQDELSSLDV